MAKFWTIDPDLLGTAQALDEDIWFELWQPLLLQMVNTEYGRDLLCIPRHYPRIVKMTKCSVQWIVEDRSELLADGTIGGIYVMSGDFRVGAKWANVIRFRWPQFKAFAKTFYEKYYQGQKILMPLLDGRALGMKGLVSANVTDTFYPNADADGGKTTCDGVAKTEYSVGSGQSWATIIASAGNGANDSSDDFAFSYMSCDSILNQYTVLHRAGFLFDLSGIVGTPTFTSAVMSINGNSASGKADEGSWAPTTNFYSFAPASNTDIVAGDFDAFGSTAYSDTDITYANIPTDDTYVNSTFNATGLAAITKGIVKIGCRNVNYDVAAVAPTWGLSQRWYMSIWFADKTGTTYDPKLVPVWSVAASGPPRHPYHPYAPYHPSN